MAGEVTTERTLVNVSGIRQKFTVQTEAPAGASIEVRPDHLSLNPGKSESFEIAIDGKLLPIGQQFFGQITLLSDSGARVVIPVAFFTVAGRRQPGARVQPDHDPAAGHGGVRDHGDELEPSLPSSTSIDLRLDEPGRLRIENVTGGATPTGNGLQWSGVLTGTVPPQIVSITPGGSPAGGYLPLSIFGIDPIPGVGDEELINFNVPAFKYGSEVYTRIGMVSNGYAVVGGGTSTDIDSVPQIVPRPVPSEQRSRAVLDGSRPEQPAAPSVPRSCTGRRQRLARPRVGGRAAVRHGRRTLVPDLDPGTGTRESITYALGGVGPGDAEVGLTVGAENRDGSSGVNLGGGPGLGHRLHDHDSAAATGSERDDRVRRDRP